MKIYHHVDDCPKSVMESAMTGRTVVVLDNEGKEYMSILVPQEPLFEEGIWKDKWKELRKHLEEHLENYPDEIYPVWQIVDWMDIIENRRK